MINLIRALRCYLSLQDYDAAKERAIKELSIPKKYRRGMTEQELDTLHHRGNKAARRLKHPSRHI